LCLHPLRTLARVISVQSSVSLERPFLKLLEPGDSLELRDKWTTESQTSCEVVWQRHHELLFARSIDNKRTCNTSAEKHRRETEFVHQTPLSKTQHSPADLTRQISGSSSQKKQGLALFAD